MIALGTAATRYWRTSLVVAGFAAASMVLGSAAWAQGNPGGNASAMRFVKAITIPATPQNPVGKMFSFDISWVDPATGLYFLADRSNSAVDVVDTTGAFTGTANTLFGQIGGQSSGQANFKGDTGSTATSGPDGVVSAFPCIFAGDGDSRLLSFAAPAYSTVVSAMNTGGTTRVDEMAVDPVDGIITAANNAETPPFATTFTYNKTTCALSNPIKTTFNAASGVDAQNGAEQPAWDPVTKRFYVSIPQVGSVASNGGVARVNPTTGVIEAVYPVNFCSPGGLSAGPNGDLMVGCSTVFDKAGNACSAVVPSPAATGAAVGHPALCTGTSGAQVAICNPSTGCTGNSLVSVQGVGGGDELYYNSGDGNYYVTAGNLPIGPSFGVVASGLNAHQPNTLTQLVPTVPAVPAVPGDSHKVAGAHGAGTAHSIAAAGNFVYVPLPANTSYPNCSTGCVAVFSAQ
jgi:hypothetical protein